MKKRSAMLILLLLAACGGGGSNSPSVSSNGNNNSSGGNNASLQTIAITPANPSQQLGQLLQLTATGAYSDGTTRDLTGTATWSSTNTSVATVTAAAIVGTVSIGTSTITATSSGVVGSATMVVKAGPTSVSFLYTFGAQGGDGFGPGFLLQGRDGNFYGTTGSGGVYRCLDQPNFCGTVFKITQTGTETVLYSFGASASDGFRPGGLIQSSDGNFYGTTSGGGAYGAGTVFKISLDGVETVLYSFGASPSDGVTPLSLILASDGNFYGTTAAGGANSCLGAANFCGTVFKITPAGVETVLYSFGASAADGWEPNALMQASDGNFYGTTSVGGANSCAGYSNYCGTIFKITPAGVETVFYSFGASPSDGVAPQGSLIQASDGNFYGTTASGGANTYCNNPNGCGGTVFRITPAGIESILHSFPASPSDGNGPSPVLIQARNGNLYGTTYTGGANSLGPYGDGSVFEITLAGIETVLYSFGGSASAGADPGAGLIQANDGNLYGVTSSGGLIQTQSAVLENTGTVFKLVP